MLPVLPAAGTDCNRSQMVDWPQLFDLYERKLPLNFFAKCICQWNLQCHVASLIYIASHGLDIIRLLFMLKNSKIKVVLHEWHFYMCWHAWVWYSTCTRVVEAFLGWSGIEKKKKNFNGTFTHHKNYDYDNIIIRYNSSKFTGLLPDRELNGDDF